MIKIDVVSDLHMELLDEASRATLLKKLFSKKPRSKLLILCGDIADPSTPVYTATISRAALRYERVIVILGNHECYNHTVEEACALAIKACSSMPNVKVLNNSSYEGEGFIIYGTTLWTNIIKEEKFNVSCLIRDFKRIKDWSVGRHGEEHAKALAYLSRSLYDIQEARTRGITVIVATHHLPSRHLVHKMHADSNVGSAFVCTDMDDLIELADVWVCGHTHKFMFYKGFSTVMMCNPVGYAHEYAYDDEYDAPRVVTLDAGDGRFDL
jgi:predicted phosphodiesterase